MNDEICFDFDVHICGGCRSQLPTIDLFLQHKQQCEESKCKIDQSESQEELGLISDDLNKSDNETSTGSTINASDFLQFVPTAQLSDDIEMLAVETNKESEAENAISNLDKNVFANTGSLIIAAVNPVVQNKSQVKFTVLCNGGPKRYKCEFTGCTYTSLYMKDLERHFRTHTGEKPYFCWHCGKRFTRSDKLKNHERTHTGERPHKCNHCNYATIDRSTLLKHMRIHSDERPFKCQICPHASRNSSQLIIHLRTHTGDTPFHCPVCSMKFKVNCDLKRHMHIHTGVKPFSCNLCDYKCSVKGNLKTHLKLKHAEDTTLRCADCEFVSNSRSELRDHLRTHVEKAVQCPQCPYSASNQSTLKIHQRIHDMDKPFKCQLCNYASRQSCNIRTHVKKKHPEKYSALLDIESPSSTSAAEKLKKRPLTFQCNFCSAGFVRKDSLQSHLKWHRIQSEQTLQPAAALAVLQLQSVSRENISISVVPACSEESQENDSSNQDSTDSILNLESEGLNLDQMGLFCNN